jgi:putative hydrolase of the HAD superfamily
MTGKTIIWDFDGTIANRPYTWSGSLLSAFNELIPGHSIHLDQIRKHTSKNFPWHEPSRDYFHLREPAAWWTHMESVLFNLISNFVSDSSVARSVVAVARKRVVDPALYRVFPDVIPTLDRLSELGWTHVILSNNYPELESVVSGMGLRGRFHHVYTSALIGYEKPRGEIFEFVLSRINRPSSVWMIGDSERADAWGAEKAGINSILVRTLPKSFHRAANDLYEASKIIIEE